MFPDRFVFALSVFATATGASVEGT
jgi:hypothetical protein